MMEAICRVVAPIAGGMLLEQVYLEGPPLVGSMLALAGAAVLLNFAGDKIDRAAIALIGVDTGPVRLPDAESLLKDECWSDALLEEAANKASVVSGLDDVHATAAYRQKIAVVMVRRALEQAIARYNGEAMAA